MCVVRQWIEMTGAGIVPLAAPVLPGQLTPFLVSAGILAIHHTWTV